MQIMSVGLSMNIPREFKRSEMGPKNGDDVG